MESITAQKVTQLEIIIIDDGSTDGTPEILRQLAEKDSRIKIITQENRGQGIARNRGLDIAAGDYVSFVDCDDKIHPHMYRDMLEAATRSKADIVQCNINDICPGISKRARATVKTGLYRIDDLRKFFASMISRDRYSGECCNKLYRKNLADRVKFKQTSKVTAEDLLYNLEILLEVKSVYFIGKAYYNYYHNTEDIQGGKDEIEKLIELFGIAECRLREKGLYEKLARETGKLAFGIISERLVKLLDDNEDFVAECMESCNIRRYLYGVMYASADIYGKAAAFLMLFAPRKIRLHVLRHYKNISALHKR